METTTIKHVALTIEKRNYIHPTIEQIQLDNEISLALESTPPIGPGELMMTEPDFFTNDPLNTLI